MEVRLTIVGGKASRKVITVKLPAVIGRSREADLTIAHPMVSRRHCELFEVQGLVRIRDLDSLNGTLVGGKEITEVPLRPNDDFSIGPLTFRVEYDYAGDVTVVAPIVPEEEPADTPGRAPPAPGNRMSVFSLPLENPPQGEPKARGETPGQRGAKPAGLPVSAEFPPQADIPQRQPLADSQEGGLTSAPPSGESGQPVAPPPLFGDWIAPLESSAAEAGFAGPAGLDQPVSGSEGGEPVEPLELFADYSLPSAPGQPPLVELPSESPPFGQVPGEPQEAEGAARAPALGAPSWGQTGAQEPPAEGPTVLAQVPDSPLPADSIFEQLAEDQSLGFEAVSWPEASPPPEGTPPDDRGTPVVPAAELAPGNQPKSIWRWWPFGRRKVPRQSAAGSPAEKPIPANPPGPEPPLPPGTAAASSPPVDAAASAESASSARPPSGPRPPVQSNAPMNPDLEAFFRDLQ